MQSSRHLVIVAVAALAVSLGAAVHGCDGSSGNRTGKPNYFIPLGGGGGGGGGQTTPDLTATAPPNPPAAIVGGVGHAMTIRVVNSNATQAAQLQSITFKASGTVDESVTLIKSSLIHDLNVNGIIELAEPVLNFAQPAFPTNDGSVTFTITPPVQIPANGTVQVLVQVDLIAATGLKDQIPLCGQTCILSVQQASDIVCLLNNQPVAPTGVYPLTSQTVGIGTGPHVMITEVSYANGNAEFIEIFNPTAGPVSLQQALLTDYTEDLPQGVPPRFYYLRPQVPFDFGPLDPQVGRDFMLAFPFGAAINPGEFQVIAVDGAGFAAAFPTVTPNYTMRNPGNMLIWSSTAQPPQFVQGSVGPQVDLNDNGEPLWLFGWNGTSDLIFDVDIVGWGTVPASGQPNEYMITKSGVSVDGPDAGNTPSPFATEVNATIQEQARKPVVAVNSGQSMQRQFYDERTEVFVGGNGSGGHDETSEKFDQNFINAAATPGAPEP